MTVRHTPLTARLSPGTSSGASRDPIRRRNPPLVGFRSTSSPTPSTRPVNIALYQDIRTERRDSPIAQIRRRKSPLRQQRHAAASDHVRRDVQPHIVDQALVPGRRVHRGATLEQQRTDLPRSETLQGRAKRPVPGHLNLRAARFEPRAQPGAFRRRCGGDDDDRPGVTCREHSSMRRCPKAPIEDHADQRALAVGASRGQLGVVDENRSAADADRVDLGPDPMGVAIGRRRRQMGPLRRRCGDAAVQTGRGLQNDKRPSLAHQREKRQVQLDSGLRRQTDVDGDAARPQNREAAAAHRRIRIFHRGDDAHDAGVDDPADARAGAPLVTARLERAVQRRAPRPRTRRLQRVDLGVRLARALVEPLTNDDAVRRHDDRADERIGTGSPGAARRVKERPLHVAPIGAAEAMLNVALDTGGLYHFSSNRPFTYSSAENGTRSSMPSPTPTYRIGSLRSWAMATATPPLAVPSSLASTIPFTPATPMNSLAWATPFWPTVASSTRSTSCGAPGTSRAAIRRIFSSSFIRFARVCRRPAVSMRIGSRPFAVPDEIASNTTAAGSAPSRARTMSTPARAAQISSCSTAAARKVSAAQMSGRAPSLFSRLASLPTVVVLPVPLTPTISVTCGR